MPWPVSGARDCWLAMQAFSPQLRLLLGLTDKRCWAAPSFSPPRRARLYLFVFVFLTVLCKHSEEFHSDFFFWTSTRQQLAFAAVLLCFRNVLIRTLKAFKSPSVPTYGKKHNGRYVGEVFSPGIYIYRQKYKGNVPMFTHLFVHEQVMKTTGWKLFSFSHRLGSESQKLSHSVGFSALCKGNYW